MYENNAHFYNSQDQAKFQRVKKITVNMKTAMVVIIKEKPSQTIPFHQTSFVR
jgi:hypothetical protein